MKKMKLFSLLVVVLIGMGMFLSHVIGKTMGVLTKQDIKTEIVHNSPFLMVPVAIVNGDTTYISSIELKGRWEETSAPAAPWPWQGLAWLKDPKGDNPLGVLDWTGITIDTTWTAPTAAGGTYKISKKTTQSYKNGAFASPSLKGWLAPTNVYSVDVYTVKGATAAKVQTLTFDPAKKDTAFSAATWELTYGATGTGAYPAATTPRPDQLIAARIDSRINFSGGLPSKSFIVPEGTDSLRYVFKIGGVEFARTAQPVVVTTITHLGATPKVQVLTPTPASGYFSAGDTLLVQIDVLDDAGDAMKWDENLAGFGINKVEMIVSGPKRDYECIFPLRNLVNNYLWQYDSLTGKPYAGKLVKFVLPSNLPPSGTYTIFVSAKRIFGTTVTNAVVKDFQVGTTVQDSIPVSSKIAGRSCASATPCHGLNYPQKHHGAKGVEQCLPCHVDNYYDGTFGFEEIIHDIHSHSPKIATKLGDCSVCHLNEENMKFSASSPKVCTVCHGVVPSMPTDHAAAVPLYAKTGMSCATVNCHEGGGMGNFKTIAETHAALDAKYPGGTVIAKRTTIAPVVDGVVDALWSRADSIVTKTGITVKFMWDKDQMYVLTQWKDGHKMYGNDSAACENNYNPGWRYDGSAWVKTSNAEDRLSITWPMTDPLGASCAQTCHEVGVGHKGSTGRMDNWHWKAARSNPRQTVDDQYWDYKVGRKSDAGVSAFGTANSTGSPALPKFQALNDADNTLNFLFDSKVKPFVNSGWTIGQTLPGWVVNDTAAISGSVADVKAKGVFNKATGVWTVEFARALKTSTVDDATFDTTKATQFTIAQFDNTGGGHATQGIDVGVYKVQFSSALLGVQKNIGAVESFSLQQNYPNPFNPSTAIRFSTVGRTHVSVKVFDITGREISVLVNEELQQGSYTVQFDGRKFASGVYFYTIKAGSFVETRKMLMLK
ncbi:MAG TPA: ethylbenzene dehydrogenase-related protein [Bacteroidota bacterium]|nr:ethylbenzene dehydrogenase-related protein [Bacteroidota bacterium]